MLLLGLDIETTGLDVKKDKVIEIGAILWDTVRSIPLRIFSELVWYPEIWNESTSGANPALAMQHIEECINISNDDLVNYGRHPKVVFPLLLDLINSTNITAVVAHNGNKFDKPLLYNDLTRWGFALPQIHWIDTQYDVPYPNKIKIRQLTYLAAEHGFINPFAHRAIFDVLTMLKTIQSYDIDWIHKLSKIPTVTLVASIDYPSNHKVKTRGYHFRSEDKKWIKSVFISHMIEKKYE